MNRFRMHHFYSTIDNTYFLSFVDDLNIYVDDLFLCSMIPIKNRPKHIRLALRPTDVTVP